MRRNACILKTLANPMLNGILLGLEWTEYELKVDESMLPCCAGRGYMEDHERNSQTRCDLQKRMKASEALIVQYLRTWSHCREQLPHKLGAAHSSKVLRQVADALKGYRPQGTVTNGKPGRPSELWAMALTSVWRFGIEAHVVNLSKFNPKDLLPAKEKESNTLAIFVEQVDKLWDDKQAGALEALVNYAYRSNTFLWIEFCKEGNEKVQEDDLSLKANFSRRISKLKNRSPYEFLDADCVSRLKSLCSFPKSILSEGDEYD